MAEYCGNLAGAKQVTQFRTKKDAEILFPLARRAQVKGLTAPQSKENVVGSIASMAAEKFGHVRSESGAARKFGHSRSGQDETECALMLVERLGLKSGFGF